MAASTKSFFHPAVMKQVTGIDHMRKQLAEDERHDPTQMDMFDTEHCVPDGPPIDRDDVGGVRMHHADVERIKKVLLAKYFSHCLGQPVWMIARLLNVSAGHASRLVRANLPVTANPMSMRTITDAQMAEMGLRERTHPDSRQLLEQPDTDFIVKRHKRNR